MRNVEVSGPGSSKLNLQVSWSRREDASVTRPRCRTGKASPSPSFQEVVDLVQCAHVELLAAGVQHSNLQESAINRR